MRIDKDKTLDRHKIDVKIATEDAVIGKAMIEIIAEIEVDRILEDIIVMTGANQRERSPTPRIMVIDSTIVQIQAQRPGVDKIQE